jgi:hypothetical protein
MGFMDNDLSFVRMLCHFGCRYACFQISVRKSLRLLTRAKSRNYCFINLHYQACMCWRKPSCDPGNRTIVGSPPVHPRNNHKSIGVKIIQAVRFFSKVVRQPRPGPGLFVKSYIRGLLRPPLDTYKLCAGKKQNSDFRTYQLCRP